jgi:hypothetical protein
MSDWVLVPSLAKLREEFDEVAPHRDRGADGSVGDKTHTPSSDHTPDEDSDILRDRDPDHKNEVHALDIDSSGPWPGGWAWFDAAIKRVVDRHRRGEDDRLQYVIWDRRIANRDIGNWKWRTYTGSADPHVDHAHFSARYTTAQEQDTSAWDVVQEEKDMQLSDKIKLTDNAKQELGGDYAKLGVVTVETALNLLLIYGPRAARSAGEADATLDKLSDPAAPVDATVAVLRQLLGDRAKTVGAALAAGQ